MKKRIIHVLIIAFSLLIPLTSCRSDAPKEAEANQPAAVEQVPAEEKKEETVQEKEESEVTPVVVELIEKKEITIPAGDSRSLDAVYYPSKYQEAPLVILMHWAPGDQKDWVEIAHWLQNSGFGGNAENPNSVPWLDPSWFPEMDESRSYSVLTFTFNGCDGGCSSFDPSTRETWLVDAKAVVEYAHGMEGVIPDQIIVVGASIGADGAADGCLHLNTVYPGSCPGSFSISSGSYLTLEYEQVVRDLGALASPVPAACLYAENDSESAAACGNFEAENYTAYPYPASVVIDIGHGMLLVEPSLDPNPLDLLVKFLEDNFKE